MKAGWVKQTCKRCGSKFKVKETVPAASLSVTFCVMCGRNNEDYEAEEDKD